MAVVPQKYKAPSVSCETGALETVIEDETGVFFDDPSPHALVKAVEHLRSTQQQFNPTHIAASVQRFNKQRFLREFSEFTQL